MVEDKINNIIEFLSKVTGVTFDGERYVVNILNKPDVDRYNIPHEEFGDVLRLKLNFYFEENLKYLEELESEIKSVDITLPLIIVSSAGTVFLFHPNTNAILEYGIKDPVNLIRLENLIAYYKLFNHFKSTSFCDYYNSANDEIIFYSSINGIIKVKHDIIPPIFNKEKISKRIDNILELASPIEVSPFLKNALYTISKDTGILKFTDIIYQSEEIIAITKRNYELTAKKFDFEKFRNSLFKEKEKYFSEIREIIGKIFSQAIGIPISISASVFATYKVSDNTFMLILVLLAYTLYVLFYIKIQTIYKSDLLEIENDFIDSYAIISIKSGLSTDIINKEKGKIERKIKSTNDIIFWSILLVSILGILVGVYIGYEILFNEAISFIKPPLSVVF